MTTTSADWAEILKAVALEVLGQPTERRGNEWRYGRHGSLVVNISGPGAGATSRPATKAECWSCCAITRASTRGRPSSGCGLSCRRGQTFSPRPWNRLYPRCRSSQGQAKTWANCYCM